MVMALIGVLAMLASDLPVGSAPQPVALPHFPDRLHAFVWRNWPLVPTARMAQVVGARPEDILRLGKAMGLPDPQPISPDQQHRSALTVIRRNWHLLPYEQLLQLLDWTPDQLAYTLREDDFLYIKLGSLKPQCAPVRYAPPDPATRQREGEIARIVHQEFPQGLPETTSPLFAFVRQLEQREGRPVRPTGDAQFSPRFCYSYFALYGDPLLDKQADPYPEGYLERLEAAGVDGVWLQAVLYKLAPFPGDPHLSEHYQERLKNLRALTARAKRHGIGIYLYLNEPRAMPLAFYAAHPAWKGVVEGDHAALCTSHPEVQKYLTDSIASLCRAVPDLAGFFTITASENLTNCWSHGGGANCPRCGKRSAAEVIAEVNALIHAGIRQAQSRARLIAWDWGWPDNAAEDIIKRLPTDVSLMSVSEWNLPIRRGGVEHVVGEYSVSAIGPGPRARQHWEWARQRGLKTLAKIQAANSWELSAVPYIPALANVAQHAANLKEAHLDGLMLGWTLGGYPSPNLEVVAEVSQGATPEGAMLTVAKRRYGAEAAPAVVKAWRAFSAAFQEFPFDIGLVYTAPMQYGPSNLLWGEPTGYRAIMIGFPYDDLDTWRAVYPPEVFIGQFEKVADGFEAALRDLEATLPAASGTAKQRESLLAERRVAEAAAIHFRSTAHQARFVLLRRALEAAKTPEEARPILAELEQILSAEIALAHRLYTLQSQDSRLGFEASNQYYYVPVDLLEKILNCVDLRDRWLPAQRARHGL
ncbi:MAG TPA: hypothetical protein VKU00_10180 [Chthonomonadaceae bacterium]|nr:hypothetical protein [Chthonomonadaceae bacterium]